MTKSRFVTLLKAARISQAQAARDLGIWPQSITKWPADQIPNYAAWYVISCAYVDAEIRELWRAEIS